MQIQGAAVLGLLLSAAGSTSSALGQTLQRLSRLRAEQVGMKPVWRRPLWFLGSFLYFIASVLDGASYFYAPMAGILVMYSVRLPVVALMAHVMLGARISFFTFCGIMLCAVAAGTSLYFAPESDETLLQRPSDFLTPRVVVYLVLSTVACIILMASALRGRRGNTCLPQALVLPVLAAWVMSLEKIFNAGLGRLPTNTSWYQVEWVWMPVAMFLLAQLGGLMNVLGVEWQSTHTFIPAVFGSQAFIMGVQSTLFGEFASMPLVDFACWSVGMLGAVLGTCLVGGGDEPDEKKSELEAQLAEKC